MLLPMLTLPLITSLTIGLFGRKVGIKGTNILVITSLGISALLSVVISNEVILVTTSISLELGTWLDTGKTIISWGFTIDALNAWLTVTVLIVSFLVHIFAASYMAGDPSPQKFMALLLSFTGFMVILITGDNLAVLFVGWEGIGITSYLLIGYWFDRALACNAAAQAIIVNRIGDLMLTLAIVILIAFWGSGTLDLHGINLTFTLWCEKSYFNIVGIFLVLAAAGKSAQFLLHTWLPAAMEGPTPVSSLLHAATLVMSGIYLLLRLTNVLSASTIALVIATFLGIITALFAASVAIVQNDIKRVIAYSTCSQFGYMFASVGTSQTFSTVLHLSNHAGFKALLFICAGGTIHSMKDEQDMRKLGGVITLLPFTYAAMLVASLSLMAMPYLSGNSSKDLILELAAVHITVQGGFLWILGSLVAGITACYSIRLIALTFYGLPSAAKSSYSDIHEQPIGLITPMVSLSFFSIFLGYLAKEPLAGMGSDSVVNYFIVSSINTSSKLVEAEFGLDIFTKNLPVICTVIGTLAGIFLFILTPVTTSKNKSSVLASFKALGYNALSAKWLVDSMYARSFSWSLYEIGLFCSKTVDRGVLELLGASGTTKITEVVNLALTGKKGTSISSITGVESVALGETSYLAKSYNSLTKVFSNNVPEYALYIGIIAILLTLSLIANSLNLSQFFILALALVYTSV